MAHIAELESKLDFKFLQSLNAEATNKESLTLDSKEFQNILNTLPIPPKEGWERKKIGEVLSLEYGRALPESQRVQGEYPVMGSNGIVGYHNEYIAETPCIIVGRKGSAGKINYVEKNCYPIDTTFYIKLKVQYNMGLLYFIMQNLNLEKEQIGIGVPGINRNNIYALQIPLPPLKSQQQIVNVIENIESHITHLDSITPLLESKKQEIFLESLM
ncbi:restriction endonuclease subunit S [Helicobacter apodemus]|uniref:restriction endonuclease subunit S n=1 Tax=Helicobacter apodemus TaxID=135569 RepID=UPI0013A545AC|nr:restriction endonuclease subunit S [Helicobacter apodemus]